MDQSKKIIPCCFNIRPIFEEWQQKDYFPPIDSSAVVGPLLLIAICPENGDVMHKSTGILGHAYSVFFIYFFYY